METKVHHRMSKARVTLVDYGMGNIWSVISALKFLDADVTVSSDPNVVKDAKIAVLPGVGSFRKAMESLHHLNLDEAIIESVQNQDHKILGICL